MHLYLAQVETDGAARCVKWRPALLSPPLSGFGPLCLQRPRGCALGAFGLRDEEARLWEFGAISSFGPLGGCSLAPLSMTLF